MSIEKKIDELIAALDRNTAALQGGPNKAIGDVPRVAAPAPKPATPAPAAEEPAAEITKETVQKRVTALVAKVGREAAAKALAKVNAKNASGIKPEDYAAFIADTDILLATAGGA